MSVFSELLKSQYDIVRLKDLLETLTDGTHFTPKYVEKGISFVSATNVTENHIDFKNVKYITNEEHQLLLKRCFPKPGDILLTKIGSIGRAAVIPADAPDFSVFVSVALLKAKSDVNTDYLCAFLNTHFAYNQFYRHLKGIGVPDLHLENIAETLVILPKINIQKELVTKLLKSHKESEDKKKKANELIHCFYKNTLMDLGLSDNHVNNNLCYAIKYKNLDGVIDVKRYSYSAKTENSFAITDICEIVNTKVNVSNYGNNIIDWIRIDDLTNQPIEIEIVRTQPANEVDGAFFEVHENDILVARLGPTILNQKIVMVRKIERTTIASSEFLVLRCKSGYEPEAVMAVLKTEYYMNLMYSHARGSTPSRYRLNREDMLQLPFPDITDKQEAIATEAVTVREEVVRLRNDAEKEWQESRKQFEKELLGEQKGV